MAVMISRLAIAFIGFFICTQLAILTIKAAGANTQYYSAQNSLAASPGTLPKERQVSDAFAYISSALNQMPHDADILDLAGRADYFRAIYERNPSKKLELFQQSKQKHLAALEQRPLWPYSEVNILYASSAAGEIDQEFLHRFTRAKELGPDDKSVIRDLARLGIKNWNDFPDKTQKQTIALTEQVLKRRLINERELRSYMSNHGQFHRICAQLQQFIEKQSLCNS